MSYAIAAAPAYPALPISARTMQRAARRAAGTVGFALQSTIAALFIYLVLAGPGLLTDRSSTTAPGGLAHVAAIR